MYICGFLTICRITNPPSCATFHGSLYIAYEHTYRHKCTQKNKENKPVSQCHSPAWPYALKHLVLSNSCEQAANCAQRMQERQLRSSRHHDPATHCTVSFALCIGSIEDSDLTSNLVREIHATLRLPLAPLCTDKLFDTCLTPAHAHGLSLVAQLDRKFSLILALFYAWEILHVCYRKRQAYVRRS